MIIFNLWAIPVGIVIGFVLYGLGRMWPALTDDPLLGWTIGGVAVVIGGIAAILGISARLFFLPIWLLGLGVLGFQLGWIGTLVFLVVVIGSAVWWSKTAKKKEAAEWEQRKRTPPAPMPAPGKDEVQFWTWVKASLFLPHWSDYTPEICDHNLPILQSVRESGVPLSPEETEKICAMENFLKQAKAAAEPPGADAKIGSQFNRLVEGRLGDAKAKAGR